MLHTLFVSLLLACAALRPGELQTKIADVLLRHVSAKSPYQIHIDRMTGGFLTHFTLHGVHIRADRADADLLTAKSLGLSIVWSELLRGRMTLRTLHLDEPVVRVTLTKDGRLELPEMAADDGGALPFLIQRLRITQGKLILVSRAVQPARDLTVAAIAMEGSVAPEDIAVSRLTAQTAGGSLDVRGHVGLDDPFNATLDVRAQGLALERAARLFRAVPAPLHLTQSGRYAVRVQDGHWSIRGAGTLDAAPFSLDVAEKAAGYEGRIALKALPVRDAWRDPDAGRMGTLSADFAFGGAGASLKKLDAKGRVQIVQTSTIGVQAPTVIADVRVTDGQGAALVAFNAQGLTAGATVHLDLQGDDVDGLFNAQLTQWTGLAEWVPAMKDAGGTLSAEGSFKGPPRALTVAATLTGKTLRYKRSTLEQLDGRLKTGLGAGKPLTVSLTAKKIAWASDVESPWDVDHAEVEWTGPLSSAPAKATVAFRNDLTFTYKGRLRTMDNGRVIAWDKLTLDPKKGSSLRSTRPGEVRLLKNGTCVVRNFDVTNGHGDLHVPEASLSRRTFDLQAKASDVSLGTLASLFMPTQKIDGVLNAETHLRGSWKAPEGPFEATVTNGVVGGWSYKRFVLKGHASPPVLVIDDLAVETANASNAIHGQGRVPMRAWDAQQPQVPMKVHLEAPHIDLGLLTAMVPGLKVEKGDAAFVLDATGEYPDPDMNGRLTAHFPHIADPKIGLDATDVALDIESRGKTVAIREFRGKTKKKGTFKASGESVWPELNYTLEGHNVYLKIPKQLDLSTDFTLRLLGSVDGPDLSGDITLLKGTYTQPQKTKKEKEAAAKAKAAGPSEPSDTWLGTTLNVRAYWARQVWYRDGLTKIETTGDLRIQKDEDSDSPYMTGRMSIVRGSYDAYGRDFILNSADVIFTGPPDINPVLNIEASYNAGGTIVYLDVKGTYKEPQLTLRSDPSLAQEDIISVLIFGHPLNQINAQGASDQTTSAQAAAAAGSVLGGYLTRDLRESGMNLGLDVVRVDPTNTGGNRLTVGRYIGERLFVSYGQPIQGNATRVFDANYYLTSHWALVGETGPGIDTYMDVLFRYPLNPPASGHPVGFAPTGTPSLAPAQALPFPQANPVAH